jgi:chlorobactene glucosyltransferase
MVLLLLLGATGLLDIFVLARLAQAFRLLNIPEVEQPSNMNLPTVSICISARNETHAMTQCLEHVVASEYPKLEVIVLDDGSRDDTSLLIKSFAHAGVRFIEGKPLPDGWLGKNYAQSILAKEASGEYVFYMDVDTLVDRHTVTRAIATMTSRKLRMMSIIPLRNDHWAGSTLFTTMRHFWAMMRHTPKHPRATANAWLIERKLLAEEFVTNTALPMSMKVETSIARSLAPREYALTLSNKWLGLRYEKKWSSQVETSVRVLFQQCHQRISEVLLLAVLLLVALVPYAAVWFTPWATALIVAQYVLAYYYLSHIWVRYRAIGALLFPLTVIQEIALLFISMYRYKFGTVTWKGRPITAAPSAKS